MSIMKHCKTNSWLFIPSRKSGKVIAFFIYKKKNIVSAGPLVFFFFLICDEIHFKPC